MATLTVGFGQQYNTIGAAVAASHDGDLLLVQAGTYANDSATINTNITLQGVGGMVKMVASSYVANDKGFLVTNANVTIDHFEFSGAIGFSGNDAGIRYQAGNLTVTNSYFHDNQNGILANPSTGTITISNSEFAGNGWGDGITHNLYVTEVAKLTVTDSFFHDAVLGHEIKSRAAETIITNNRIFDNSSTSSYSIDLPNAGHAVLTGNIIEQGSNGANQNIISFGVEGNPHAGSSLTMTGNTIINDLGRGTILLSSGAGPATVTGTQVWTAPGGLEFSSGANIAVSGTVNLANRPVLDQSHPWAAPTMGNLPGSGQFGTAADETMMGGAGADNINGGDGRNYLRGNDGNDMIQGGSGFDDANGNKGDDTISGGPGEDWVVGGQDNDLLFGENGDDVIYGNLGKDTCLGDSGNDIIRGGQEDDVIYGGIGADWLSGDRGDDTVIGGLGADIFHTFGEAGIDRVYDFDISQGDRVLVDAGTTYNAVQTGVDVTINITGGAQMILVGVTLSQLGSGWIYSG